MLYCFAVVQSIFALIIYPLNFLRTGSGDWATIYNFQIQPFASLTLIAHLFILYRLWQIYHSKKTISWRLSRYPQTLENFDQLQVEHTNRPQDLQPQLDLAHFLASHQENYAAQTLTKKIDHLFPKNPQIQVLKLVIACYKKNIIT